MIDKNGSFILYDTEILISLRNHASYHSRPRILISKAFDGLQHPELIQALLHHQHSVANRLLQKLSAPLPPKDAMAVCLCALGGTEDQMHTILDHCPPIPEFQFLGVGKTASLLNVVIRLKKHNMLDLFLKRGADPNGGPTPLTETTPLEVAFCCDAYLCLKRLLKTRGLRLELTPEMLNHWAKLHPDFCAASPEDLMCCQQLLEALTGQPTDPEDPFPLPPQLTLETVLKQLNLPLATHICNKRPLTDPEKEAAVRYLSTDHCLTLLDEWATDFQWLRYRQNADFLISFLNRYPDLVHLPELRFPIMATALLPLKPEAALQKLVAQLESGPIFLRKSASFGDSDSADFPIPKLFSNFNLSQNLFPRWDERLGRRFVPTMDVFSPLYLHFMDEEEIKSILDHIDFVGERPADKLSPVGEQFLLYAPANLLPGLMQPGGLLTQEHPRPLLKATLELPTARRNLILPYLHKDVDYEL